MMTGVFPMKMVRPITIGRLLLDYPWEAAVTCAKGALVFLNSGGVHGNLRSIA